MGEFGERKWNIVRKLLSPINKYIKEKKIEFVKPVINCKENKIYNPKTNRMEFPKWFFIITSKLSYYNDWF